MHPHRATEKGYRKADDWATTYKADEIDKFVGWAEEGLRCLSVPTSWVSEETRLRRDLLTSHLIAALRVFSPKGEARVSPVFYLQAGLDGLEALQLRYPTTPWEKLQNRLESLPLLLRSGQIQVLFPERLAVALAQEMAEESLDGLREQYDHAKVPRPVRESAWEAFRALEQFREWLEGLDGTDFQPLGEIAFNEILREEHLLARDSATWEKMALRALKELPDVTGRTDLAASSHSLTREEAWHYFVEELRRVEMFVRRSDIVSVPQGELELCQTPAYLASLIPGAYYQEPALFAGERLGRFYIPSLPQDWTSAVQTRFLARQRRGGFANLVVHEAWPGHHVQYLHAADHHDPLANVRDNDVMLEGWALYCEELMEELGLFSQTPFPPRIDSLRMRLARVVLDIGLQTGRMTVTQAENFMGDTLGVSVTPWIKAEIRRYCLEPTQPMSYWIGSVLIKELRDELGVTRSELKSFHDSLLACGPIPIPLIRGKLLRTNHL